MHLASSEGRQRTPRIALTLLQKNTFTNFMKHLHKGHIYIGVWCTWEDGVEDTENHGPQIKELQTDAAKLRDAQSYKHIIGIKQAAQDL